MYQEEARHSGGLKHHVSPVGPKVAKAKMESGHFPSLSRAYRLTKHPCKGSKTLGRMNSGTLVGDDEQTCSKQNSG